MFLRTMLATAAMTAATTVGLVAGQVAADPATAGPGPTAATVGSTEAGPGWYLATVDHGRRGDYGIEPRRQRLVLVSPEGERTRVWGKDLGRHGRGSFQLVDWSADGLTALVVVDAGMANQKALLVDVPTGSTTAVPLGESVATVLLDSAGGLLATGYSNGDHRGAPVWRISPSGERTRFGARVDGPVLPSADDSRLVTGSADWAGTGIRVLDRDGRLQQRISTSRHCTPVRWWDATTALVQCWRRTGPTLSLVDVATGGVTPLTHPHGRDSIDLGDLDARRVDSGLYLQASGPCGYVFLARQLADGSVRKVKVPHAAGNVLLLGAEDDELVIEHAISCDGATSGSALSRFDPVTRDEHVLMTLGEREAFARILPFGEQQASAY